MEQAYTFYKKTTDSSAVNLKKTDELVNLKKTDELANLKKTDNISDNISNNVSDNISGGTYQFKKKSSKPDNELKDSNKLDSNNLNFPELGTLKNPQIKKVSCWGNKNEMEKIKEPFTDVQVIPKKDIPPLFNKVRKEKIKYLDEDDYEYYENNYNEDDSDDEYKISKLCEDYGDSD